MEIPDSGDGQSTSGTPFSLNFMVALNEEKREATARSKSHWKGLSNVSFHVELVSSSIGSLSSELTAKSTVNIAPLCAERLEQGSTYPGLKTEQQSSKESTALRRMQSAPSTLLESLRGVEPSEISIDEARDELERKEVPRRHTLNNCDQEDLQLAAEKLFGDDTSPTKLHSAAFQSSKAKVRNTKKPPRIPSLTQNSCILNQKLDQPTTSNHKATNSSRFSTQHCRRDSKNTPTEKETRFESDRHSPIRLVNRGGSPHKRSRFGNQGSGMDRTSAGVRKEESSMKRVMTSLLKCFCSDVKAAEEEEA